MKIQNVAVIGAGVLGTQIALQAAAHNCKVTVFDLDRNSMGRVLELLRIRMRNSSRKPVLSWSEMKKGARMVNQCASLQEAVDGTDLVIEAVPENLALKRKVFKPSG